jgi:hypothetical protein
MINCGWRMINDFFVCFSVISWFQFNSFLLLFLRSNHEITRNNTKKPLTPAKTQTQLLTVFKNVLEKQLIVNSEQLTVSAVFAQTLDQLKIRPALPFQTPTSGFRWGARISASRRAGKAAKIRAHYSGSRRRSGGRCGRSECATGSSVR